MKGVYILSDYSDFLNEITESLKIEEDQVISVPSAYDHEHQWHSWVNEIFDDNEIDKLIIPVSLPTDTPNNLGFIIGLHIRLNYELPLEKRMIPLVFLSDFSIATIFKMNALDTDYNAQNILFTKGVVLSDFDTQNILTSLKLEGSISFNDYKLQVLKKLNISQKATEGKHSIANAWGCYKLAIVTGLGNEILKDAIISNKLKTLYAKFLICYHDVFDTTKFIDLNQLKCSNKKILLIDDRADEGWALLMKKIFSNSGKDFIYVDSSKYKNEETNAFFDFDGFYKECQSHIGLDWDLIIIDLRLHPDREDLDDEKLTPEDFSGYKLIDEFLTKNEGYQIILSTASNKIWNINAALKRGVSGYYIKESPEFNYPLSETNRHYKVFKENVEKCFEKGYLREIDEKIRNLIYHLSKIDIHEDNQRFDSFIKSLKIQLEIIKQVSKGIDPEIKNSIDIVFLSLYNILELFSEYYLVYRDKEYRYYIGFEENDFRYYKTEGDKIIDKGLFSASEVSGNKPPIFTVIIAVAHDYLNSFEYESSLGENLQQAIWNRNNFIHSTKDHFNKNEILELLTVCDRLIFKIRE